MIWNLKKFNKETEALKKLSSENSLHPLRKEQIKHALMAEINSLVTNPTAERFSWYERNINFMRYILASILGLSLVGGTAFASSNSLPGDALYRVKQVKEKIEVSLAASTESKIKLQTEFAEERLNELNKIKAKNHSENGDKTTLEVEAENNVQNAILTLTEVKTKLEENGNTEAAVKIDRTIIKLKGRHEEEASGEQDREKSDSKDTLKDNSQSEQNIKLEDRSNNRSENRDDDKINIIIPSPTPTPTASGSNFTNLKVNPSVHIKVEDDDKNEREDD